MKTTEHALVLPYLTLPHAVVLARSAQGLFVCVAIEILKSETREKERETKKKREEKGLERIVGEGNETRRIMQHSDRYYS